MQYGLQSDNLDMTSPVTATLNDFDATNRQLIVGAAGLVPNTTYYYRIQATNTVGTTNSGVLSVTTLPARELCTYKCVYFVCGMFMHWTSLVPRPPSLCKLRPREVLASYIDFLGPVEPLLQCENT